MRIKRRRYLLLAGAIIIGTPLIFIFPKNHYLSAILILVYLVIGSTLDFVAKRNIK